MSTSAFLPYAGSVFVFENSGVAANKWELNPKLTVSSNIEDACSSSYAIITAVSINGEDCISRKIGLGSHKILGVTGTQFGKINVTLTLLLGAVSSKSTAVDTVIKYIEDYRISKRGNIIELSFGNTTFEWTLDGFKIDSNHESADYNILTVALFGTLTSH